MCILVESLDGFTDVRKEPSLDLYSYVKAPINLHLNVIFSFLNDKATLTCSPSKTNLFHVL